MKGEVEKKELRRSAERRKEKEVVMRPTVAQNRNYHFLSQEKESLRRKDSHINSYWVFDQGSQSLLK